MRQCRKSARPIYSERYTPSRLNQFIDSRTKEFIRANPRGFGYWVWKPHVIIQFLQDNPGVEYLVYLDAGCELQIDSASIQIWDRYINILKTFDCLTFDNGQPERDWTKKELINFLEPTVDQIESNQIAAGVLLMNRNFALSFCVQWISTMEEKDFFFITEEVDEEIQIETFRENRYDQSVLSLLLKREKRNLTLSGNEEIYFPGKWELNRTQPIWTIRNPSLISALDTGVVAKTIRNLEKLSHLVFKVYIRIHNTK